MHREDWQSVFENQDKILKQLKPLEDKIFLAGGTGLQRFVLPKPYRHSEDLDFFFPTLYSNEEVNNIKDSIVEFMKSLPNSKLEDIRRIKEEKSWRMWYSFNG